MGTARQQSLPDDEPVSLAAAKLMVRQTETTRDDSYIRGLIVAAREHGERETNRCLARRDWVLPLDSFPGQLLDRAYGPSHYSLRAPDSSRLYDWRDLQMIKLPRPPLVAVKKLRYVATDKSVKTLMPGADFIVDRYDEPARIFPLYGKSWPAALSVPSAVEVLFTAGYAPDPEEGAESSIPFNPVGDTPGQQPDSIVSLAVPESVRTFILMLVSHWYHNREPVAAGLVAEVPLHVKDLLADLAVSSFAFA